MNDEANARGLASDRGDCGKAVAGEEADRNAGGREGREVGSDRFEFRKNGRRTGGADRG